MARTQKRRVVDDSGDSGEATDYDDAPSGSARRKSTQGSKKKGKAAQGKKRRNRDESDDDDMSVDGSGSDDDGGNKAKKGELSEDEKKHYIQASVRYILFNEAHRRVLKREDIVKHVLTDGRGKHFNALFPKVQKILKEVMGMELVLLRPREGAAAKNPPKAWILRSTLPDALIRLSTSQPSPSFVAPVTFENPKKGLQQELADWEADEALLPGDERALGMEVGEEVEAGVMRDVKREEGAAYGVLGVVLALILVNGKVLADDQLISHLRRLSLTPSTPIALSLSSPHPNSLTLASYLNLLVKQHYLERAKSGQSTGATQGGGGKAGRSQGPSRTQRATADGGVAESGDPGTEWRWGARSEVEFGEVGVARFVERVFRAEERAAGSDGDDDDEGGASQKKKGKKGKKGANGAGGGAAEKRQKDEKRFMGEIALAAGVKKLRTADEAAAGAEDE
ncbi:hypothetical protein JCM10207_007240 [Rhodosporidiobolus poonsookiae]